MVSQKRAYKTLVEPYFRYCNTTWGTCNSYLLDKLKALQDRAARTVANVKYEGTDHAKLLKKLDWFNLRELIEYDTASLVYKIENDLPPTHMKNMFIKSSEVHSYSIPDLLLLVIFIWPRETSTLERHLFGKDHGVYTWSRLPVLFKLGKLSLSNVFRIAWKKRSEIDDFLKDLLS